jgi:hypothetical protein
MAFTIAAIVLGSFTLYNLSNKNTLFTTDPQTRLENTPGNKHVNIKLNELFTFWKPIINPRQWMATETYAKRVRAREMSGSSNPMQQKMGSAVMTVNNYRRGSGKMTPIPGSNQLSSTSYWT